MGIVEFDRKELALLMAKLCKLAYRDNIRNKAKKLGFSNTVRFRNLNCECLIFENESDIVCAFRGTDDLKDVLSSLKCVVVNDSDLGLVHRGFLKECNKIYLDILMYINRENKNIWMTGHSLGGALALLCSARFVNSNNSRFFNKCVTFGAPRVGYKCFVTKFADLCHDRWTIDTDVVPSMPHIRGYKHHGALYCINSAKCVLSFKTHSISNYIHCISLS